MIKITPTEFDILARHILNISGIALARGKEYLVETRLSPLMESLACFSYTEFQTRIKADFKGEINEKIIDAISTNETYFFRDKAPFELLQHKIIPDLLDRRTQNKSIQKPSIRLWSAASSTGQEIYSIAMALTEIGITPLKYNIRMLGTDISDAAIAQASYGWYNKFEIARGLDPGRLTRFFNPDKDGWRIKDEIRFMAQFKKMNLMKPFIGLGKFDIILCRNVMIYFTPEDRKKIYANIAKVLEPDGYLIIGSTESLTNECDLFTPQRYLKSVFYGLK
ncbi:MAG: protein-glutamate O-methyltransferase CheR [Desulfobacterium sp.]|jgi:chemotaxis protein methyltransferase CheR|nr:protein-glutamate O-methyltransferase CheR [Desulfobacterium sp.]